MKTILCERLGIELPIIQAPMTPAAPSARAAARPRPSAMPPAATTGVGDTASTTAGTSGIVATVPLTWPPASHPWAMTISTPQSTARRTLRNQTVRSWEAAGRPPSGDRPGEGDVIGNSRSIGPIVRYQSYTPGADAEGEIDAMSLWAGQSVGLVSKLQPAGDIVREIADEARLIFQRLSK